MNERAKKLGCTGTVFENPHGLDFDEWAGDMHSTAHDVALMMQEAMKNDTIREVVASEDSWIEVTGATAPTIRIPWTRITYCWAKMATSVARPALPTMQAIALRVPTTAMATRSTPSFLNSTTTDQRFTDTATLANWYYGHKVTVAIANTQEKTANGQPAYGAHWSNRLDG